jgi:hypothetical protein
LFNNVTHFITPNKFITSIVVYFNKKAISENCELRHTFEI